jgi:hypothetical protein
LGDPKYLAAAIFTISVCGEPIEITLTLSSGFRSFTDFRSGFHVISCAGMSDNPSAILRSAPFAHAWMTGDIASPPTSTESESNASRTPAPPASCTSFTSASGAYL